MTVLVPAVALFKKLKPPTKFWVIPELLVMPAPLKIRCTLIVKALAPALNTTLPTSSTNGEEMLVTLETPNVATAAVELGTVAGFQLAAVFQSPLLGLESHAGSNAVAGVGVGFGLCLVRLLGVSPSEPFASPNEKCDCPNRNVGGTSRKNATNITANSASRGHDGTFKFRGGRIVSPPNFMFVLGAGINSLQSSSAQKPGTIRMRLPKSAASLRLTRGSSWIWKSR